MLPDRNSLLRFLHQVNACIKGLLPVAGTCRSHQCRFPDGYRAVSVNHSNGDDLVLGGYFRGDFLQCRLRSRVGLVGERDN